MSKKTTNRKGEQAARHRIQVTERPTKERASIYTSCANMLRVSKTLEKQKPWKNKIEVLSKSFHAYINLNFSQMFSYLKILDICENNITLTFHGKTEEIDAVKKEIIKKFKGNISSIYNNTEDNFSAVICKNQTCSEKLKSLEEINNYIKEKLN